MNEVHSIDTAADEVVIYGNPCTMQIILEHWTDVRQWNFHCFIKTDLIQ